MVGDKLYTKSPSAIEIGEEQGLKDLIDKINQLKPLTTKAYQKPQIFQQSLNEQLLGKKTFTCAVFIIQYFLLIFKQQFFVVFY